MKVSRLKLRTPIDKFVSAVNRGETEVFLGCFPSDGVVEDSGRRFTGRDAIRRWSDGEFIGAKGKMTVKSVRQEGNEISVTADWVSNFYTGPARFVFVLDGRWLRELRITGV